MALSSEPHPCGMRHFRIGRALQRHLTVQEKEYTADEAKEGDLVFFKIRKNKISHVGIYLGDGTFIHSPSTGKRICIEKINQTYWKKRFVGFATFIEK